MADFTMIVRDLTRRYDVRVRRWRRSMSGKAWRVYYHDGRVLNWIESPQPKTPLSLAIFLHEIGHHAIGFEKYRYRCEEEFHVWMWAVDEMRRQGLEPGEKIHHRIKLSLIYAVGKALRRRIKKIPECLLQYLSEPQPTG